ncbi:unnamed protein product [Camellia sinensis]
MGRAGLLSLLCGLGETTIGHWVNPDCLLPKVAIVGRPNVGKASMTPRMGSLGAGSTVRHNEEDIDRPLNAAIDEFFRIQLDIVV